MSGRTKAVQSAVKGGARCLLAVAAICALLCLATGGQARGEVIPSTHWVNFYGLENTVDGEPLPAGSVAAVFDSSGVQCGEYRLAEPGWYGLMACYGDDGFTKEDEGAAYDEVLLFAIDGESAIAVPVSQNSDPVPADTIVRWSGNQDLWQVELHAPALVGPALAISVDGADVVLSWPHEPANALTYEVWRSADPYFVAGAWGSEEVANVAAEPEGVFWPDSGQAAAPAAAFYRVRGLGSGSTPVSLPGAAVGKMGFELVVR